METLQKQVDAFETQQKDYHARIQTAHKEVQISRRTLQRLNAQAAEADIPEAVIEEEETNNEAIPVDGDDVDLREQVGNLLQMCLKKSDEDMIEIPSEDEDNAPAPKRQRSRDHGRSGGATS